jgi:hypothetical protein
MLAKWDDLHFHFLWLFSVKYASPGHSQIVLPFVATAGFGRFYADKCRKGVRKQRDMPKDVRSKSTIFV